MSKTVIIFLAVFLPLFSATTPLGYGDALWGDSEAQVTSVATTQLTKSTPKTAYPAALEITQLVGVQDVAGYSAKTSYYFYKNQLFQVTLVFTVPGLKNYDFNYNVFVSVDGYYREIRDKSLVFINEIYSLLQSKYGKKQPVFVKLDPQKAFVPTDTYISQERWNFRYAPSEYYKRIVVQGYAKWLYPKTEINFAINISAPDKRFDYTLSLGSTLLKDEIERASRKLMSNGL